MGRYKKYRRKQRQENKKNVSITISILFVTTLFISFSSQVIIFWLFQVDMMDNGVYLPIFVVVVGSFFTVAGTVVVTTLVLSGCGNCGKCANWGCGAAFQYSVVTGLVVTSSLLFQFEVFLNENYWLLFFRMWKTVKPKIKKTLTFNLNVIIKTRPI